MGCTVRAVSSTSTSGLSSRYVDSLAGLDFHKCFLVVGLPATLSGNAPLVSRQDAKLKESHSLTQSTWPLPSSGFQIQIPRVNPQGLYQVIP